MKTKAEIKFDLIICYSFNYLAQYFNLAKWTREYGYLTLDYNDLADYIDIDEAKLLEAAQVILVFKLLNQKVLEVKSTKILSHYYNICLLLSRYLTSAIFIAIFLLD